MDAWATHIPMLVNFVCKTKKPVLELGMGDYSTPILHHLCQDRHLVSTEYKKDWMEKFKDLESPIHKIFHVEDWDSFDINMHSWGVAFVDHSPGERRVADIDRLINIADFVIVHDSQEAGYKYEPSFAKYKYRYDYKRYETYTTVLSNFFNPKDYL